jgi:hypothetical protein
VPYADLALLKFHLSSSTDSPANFSAEDTILLQLCLDAATGMIDRATGRTFVGETGATKYFTATNYDTLDLSPDIRTVTSVAIDDDGDLSFGTVLASTDYWKLPIQPYPDSGIYSQLRLSPRSSQAFAPGYQVKVVGDWGYVVGGQAPAAVRQACLLQAARLWSRRGTPLGIVGGVDLTTFTRITKADADVQALLSPYVAGGGVRAGVY